jgi:hypothetical protein
MNPIARFSAKDIKFARTYVTKHTSSANLNTEEIVLDLCDNAQKLLEENAALKEQLFEIEQEQDPGRQWETILAAKLARAVRENKNKEHLEFFNSTNNDIFIVTIQRKFGQSPEQLRYSSEIRRLKAAKKIVNLLRDNKIMQSKIIQLNEDLRILKAVKNTDWDDIKTREDIERAIDMVNYFIKQHNQVVYRKHLGKLTNSMRESYHEAWTRAADASWKVSEIKKELEALKFELHRKNVEKSKFSKYRKRRKSEVVARYRPFFGRK